MYARARPLIAFVVLASGCGPRPAPSTSQRPQRTRDDAKAGATATFENVIAEGVMQAEDVNALLAPLEPELAACLTEGGIPTTTELSLVFPFPSGEESAVRAAWRDGVFIEIPTCLAKHFPGSASVRFQPARFTNVYVVIRTTSHKATAPAAPVPPERRAEFEMFFCDVDRLANASALKEPAKSAVMSAWARQHVRHPGPWETSSSVVERDASEWIDYLEKAIRAVGIKKCRFQGW
jgi:hypothetical protein